jgi:P27 family predicted phage terminase small subunit
VRAAFLHFVPPASNHHQRNHMKRMPKPPQHLSEAGRTWWRTCVKTYELEPHHLRLLQSAAECWDRQQQARAILDAQGITFVDDRGNTRAHPAVAIERDARVGFARILRELDLDVPPPADIRTSPVGLRSNRRLSYAG